MSFMNLVPGIGRGSWHVGVHCTTAEAYELVRAIHAKFGELIERGVLMVERTAWSLALQDERALFDDAPPGEA